MGPTAREGRRKGMARGKGRGRMPPSGESGSASEGGEGRGRRAWRELGLRRLFSTLITG